MNIEKIFGEILKENRLRSKKSQEELANICHLDRTFISMIERGIRQPSLKTILKISKALKIKAFEMIKEVEERLDNDDTNS